MKRILILVVILLAGPIMSVAQWNPNGTHIYNTNAGNVGIGINTPDYKLHIKDGVGGAQLKFQRGTGIATILQDNNVNNLYLEAAAGLFLNSQSYGKVGIGTISPITQLHLMDVAAGGPANTSIPNQGLLISGNSTGGSLNMGIDATGTFYSWIQSRRRDDNTTYILALNPSGGNVGIGTTAPDAKLAVKGTIHAQEVKVDLSVPGPDYVFEETYSLPSLTDTENYIKQNKHLPEVPSACEMEENGISLSEMNMLLLKKVEELTLYLIDQNKMLIEQVNKVKSLEEKLNKE